MQTWRAEAVRLDGLVQQLGGPRALHATPQVNEGESQVDLGRGPVLG